VLLRQIAQKMIPTIETKQINEYMLNENVYQSLSLGSFLRAHSVAIIFALFILLIVFIVIATYMIRNGMQIQKLMYKDTRMDIWNLKK